MIVPAESTSARAALYARASDAVGTADQVRSLRGIVRQRGLVLVGEYVDLGGPSARRPELDRLLDAVRAGEVDVVATVALDRIARSGRELALLVEDLVARGVRIIAVEDDLDTNTDAGRATVLGVVAIARVERALQRERGQHAIRSARRRGVTIGRPRAEVDVERAAGLRQAGRSYRQIATALGVGVATVHRALATARI